MGKYYVICDATDPGCEFETYEAAQEYLLKVQKTHSPKAIIVGPDLGPSLDTDYWRDWKDSD